MKTLSVPVSVTLVPIPHWNDGDLGMKAYDVVARGLYGQDISIGKIERSVENTDRHYGRIRVPGKGRLAWQALRNGNTIGTRHHQNIQAAVEALVLTREETR